MRPKFNSGNRNPVYLYLKIWCKYYFVVIFQNTTFCKPDFETILPSF